MTENIKKYIIYGVVGAIGVGGIYYAYTISKKSKGNQNATTTPNNSIFVPENINANIPLISNSVGSNTEIAGIQTISLENTNQVSKDRQLSKIIINKNLWLNTLDEQVSKEPSEPILINSNNIKIPTIY